MKTPLRNKNTNTITKTSTNTIKAGLVRLGHQQFHDEGEDMIIITINVIKPLASSISKIISSSSYHHIIITAYDHPHLIQEDRVVTLECISRGGKPAAEVIILI